MTIEDIKRYREQEKRSSVTEESVAESKDWLYLSSKNAVVNGELSDDMKKRLGIYQYIKQTVS